MEILTHICVSGSKRVKVGLLQGSVPSPLLFIIVINFYMLTPDDTRVKGETPKMDEQNGGKEIILGRQK